MSIESIRFVPFERLAIPKPKRRIELIQGLCTGKLVLDLGAMDETAVQSKQGRGEWLHERISRSARRVVGLDSSTLVPPEGLVTFANARIEKWDVFELGAWLDKGDFVPDVIVAGELIEHLDHPRLFLESIKKETRLSGKTLILSTPNATALHNCLIALAGMESTHRDHLAIFSFKTISTLLARSGFSQWTITPYFAEFTELRARLGAVGRFGLTIGERGINGMEYCFPLLSFGYVVEAKI